MQIRREILVLPVVAAAIAACWPYSTPEAPVDPAADSVQITIVNDLVPPVSTDVSIRLVTDRMVAGYRVHPLGRIGPGETGTFSYTPPYPSATVRFVASPHDDRVGGTSDRWSVAEVRRVRWIVSQRAVQLYR